MLNSQSLARGFVFYFQTVDEVVMSGMKGRQDLLLPAFAAFPLPLTLIDLAQEGANAGL